MLNFTPYEFLLLDVAGRFGKDKLNWSDRLLWAYLNHDRFEDLVPEAKEPILYQTAVKAVRDHQAGNPVGHPAMFDCSASGMQILSILTGDRNAARISNVIGQSFIDPYMHLHGSMQKRLGTSETIERDPVKQAIMTSLYGSEAEPDKLFSGVGLKAFYETMETEVPLCWQLNTAILDFLKTSEAEEYSWVMPDNFHVNCPVKEVVYAEVSCLGTTQIVSRKVQQPHNRNRSLGANLTHATESFLVREMIRRCNTNRRTRKTVEDLIWKGSTTRVKSSEKNQEMTQILWDLYMMTGFLSARILQYLDTESFKLVDSETIRQLMMTIPDKIFPIKTVHDCFAVHVNNALDLLLVFRNLYAELSKSNMLNYLLFHTMGVDFQLDIEDMSEDILKAEYILT